MTIRRKAACLLMLLLFLSFLGTETVFAAGEGNMDGGGGGFGTGTSTNKWVNGDFLRSLVQKASMIRLGSTGRQKDITAGSRRKV